MGRLASTFCFRDMYKSPFRKDGGRKDGALLFLNMITFALVLLTLPDDHITVLL